NYKDMDNFANYFGMDDYLDKKVKTYSIGMKQKLAIVLALTKGKKMILLDEPFNGLDILSINCALQALEDCKKNGVAVILTSHQLDISEKICDKSYFIKNATFEKIVEKARDVGTKYQFEFYNEEDCAKAYAIAQTLCSARLDKCQLVLDLNGGCSLPIVFERVAGYHVKAFHDITNSLENSYIEMEGKK
ncbi:MAG: ATP-binding cassette domain-containing protein, partial [Clostridia bacterium]